MKTNRKIADNQAVLIGGNSPQLSKLPPTYTLAQKEIKDYLFNNSAKNYIQTIIIKTD